MKLALVLLFLVSGLVFLLIFKKSAHLFLGETRKLSVQDTVREYRISKPRNLEANAPLYLVIHGYGDSPRFMQLYSGFSRLTHQGGVVVYPKGTYNPENKKLSWNAGSCCNRALFENTPDVLFLESVIDDVAKKEGINREKIFIIGFSNGGMMVDKFLSESSVAVRAAAVISGSSGGRVDFAKPLFTPQTKRPVNMLRIHGDKDDVVPFAGGQNEAKDAEFWSVETSTEFWRTANSCQIEPLKIETDVYVKNEFQGCASDTSLTTYHIKNGTHTWFGNALERLQNPIGQKFNTTQYIITFFEQY